MAPTPEPPPRPRFGGRAPAVLGIAGLLGALAIFAVVLVSVDALPNPLALGDEMVAESPMPSAGPLRPSKSARFADQGDCVINRGSESEPDMLLVNCAPDTYEVLSRIEGTTDYSECDKVDGYRFHYFYNSELGDKFDFVLCMRKRS
ncbi:MAG TPA: hypothetical protein VF062_14325 [Candidatus Limnocylindrales bacterium]